MKDYLVKALGFDGQVRAYAVVTTDTVGEAERRHHTWPTASAALGRTLTAGLLLGGTLKGEENLTIKIEGNGPLGAILVDANAKGEVRGYVMNPQTHLNLTEHGKLDVSGAVGSEGMLTVTKDLGMRDYFSGQVPLASGEIGEDFTYYLVKSEQIPSSVGLGVLVAPDNSIQAAGGFMLQLMPGVSEETITEIEEHLKTITPISQMIQKGMTPEDMLTDILGKGNVTLLENMPVQFKCRCTKERISSAIISLGKEEMDDIIQTDGKAEAQCHFCNETYFFTQEELEAMRDSMS